LNLTVIFISGIFHRTTILEYVETNEQPHRPWKHRVRGSTDPPLFQVGSKNTFWPPTFNVYKACLLQHSGHYHAMHHQCHLLLPLCTQNWHVYVLQSLCWVYSRTVILCSHNTENIHQINNECNPSRA